MHSSYLSSLPWLPLVTMSSAQHSLLPQKPGFVYSEGTCIALLFTLLYISVYDYLSYRRTVENCRP